LNTVMSLLVPEMATPFHRIKRRFIGIIVGLGSILVSSESAGYIFHWMHSDRGMRWGGAQDSGLDDVYKWHSTTGHSGCLYWGEHCLLPPASEAWISSVLWVRLLPRAIAYKSVACSSLKRALCISSDMWNPVYVNSSYLIYCVW